MRITGILILGALTMVGCGGGAGGGTTPSPITMPTSTNTITISNNTVSPKAIVVARGSQRSEERRVGKECRL